MIRNKYSVVVPTLQRSPFLASVIEQYCAHPLVAEVIVINNAQLPLTFDSPRARVLHQDTNIFVNPAWNLGARMAQGEFLVLANDDLLIDDTALSYVAKLLPRRSIGVVGPSAKCFHTKYGEKVSHRPISYPKRYFGTFLCMRTAEFVNIPSDMLIWGGDDWLFWHSSAPPVALTGVRMRTVHGTTSQLPEAQGLMEENRVATIRHLGKLVLDGEGAGVYGVRWWHPIYYWWRRTGEMARHVQYLAKRSLFKDQ